MVVEGGGLGLGVGAAGVLLGGVGLDLGQQRGGRDFLPLRFGGRGGWGASPYPSLYFVRSSETEIESLFNCFLFGGAIAFCLYRAWGSRAAPTEEGEERPDNPGVTDWLFAVLSVVALGYTLVVFDDFIRRAASPDPLDLVFGTITIFLVLEATRRTVGWILPAVCLLFIAYAYLGALIPPGFVVGHSGYGPDRIIGQTYMGLEGLFGVPLDVAATYIVLFTIYGAVLEYSGAGKYFIDVSFAAFGRSRTGPGRTTTLAGFLLGTVSGSGTATTVTLGSVAWPILKRGGYPQVEGGGVLAAAGRAPSRARRARAGTRRPRGSASVGPSGGGPASRTRTPRAGDPS